MMCSGHFDGFFSGVRLGFPRQPWVVKKYRIPCYLIPHLFASLISSGRDWEDGYEGQGVWGLGGIMCDMINSIIWKWVMGIEYIRIGPSCIAAEPETTMHSDEDYTEPITNSSRAIAGMSSRLQGPRQLKTLLSAGISEGEKKKETKRDAPLQTEQPYSSQPPPCSHVLVM
jgi:hypothetical protein